MKSKKLFTSLLALASIALVGCNGNTSSTTPATSDKPTASDNTPATSDKGSETPAASTDTKESAWKTPSERVGLNMSVYYDNDDRHMKFIQSAAAKLPYTSVDGTTYKANDFKPTWKAIQRNLNIAINDLSPTGKITIQSNFSTLVSQGFKVKDTAVDIAQGNSDQILSEGTTHDTILNLGDYLDQMPHFNKFLTDNPAVKKIISSADGKIYYAPYFDGFDDLERMLMLRQDWVTKLLDDDLPTTLDETTTLGKNYTPFYTKEINSSIKVLNAAENGTETIIKHITPAQNIIAQFNAASTLNGKTAVKMLRDYIDQVYGTTYGSKRSELFLGGRAVYDVDELVALFKCVKANSKFLTGKDNVNVIPFFPRAQTNDRTYDLYRFMQFFGLRGVESRNQWMYVDNSGKLADVRGSAAFAAGITKLHEMYQDGVIMEDFTSATVNGKTDYRGPFLSDASSSTQYGFATYDYNQTTTAYDYSNANLKLVSVMPAVADFDDGTKGNFIHYTESWRSVKTQGWFITQATAKDKKKLDRALMLFDYLYSEEGNRLMSYGPDAYLAKNPDGSIKYMDYQGKQVPVLSDGCKKELKDLANNNYTNYYRYYLGATLPVGYVKEQGMEYQTVAPDAQPSLNTLNHAIQYGVLEHVNHKSNNTSHMQDIVPTTLPFTDTENNSLGSQFTDLNKAFTSKKAEVMNISRVVEEGWGGKDTGTGFESESAYLTTVNTTYNLTGFVKLYNDAYSRYLKL